MINFPIFNTWLLYKELYSGRTSQGSCTRKKRPKISSAEFHKKWI